MRNAIAVGLALIAAPALAQTTFYADGVGGPAGPAIISLQVSATVGGHCGFAIGSAPSGSFNQPNFDATGFTYDFAFGLDCSGPSRVAVVSSNGGLLTGGSAPSGYATLAPYAVALNLVGSTTTASATCQVASLTPGAAAPCSFRGAATASTGLLLTSNSVAQTGTYLRVSAPVYPGVNKLIAGTYADTLVVTVSVAS